MWVGILAGGHGTRLAEETEIRPKPMVEIGGMPILWHIMMHYHHYGHNEFAIALGYKGEYIKRWFTDYCALSGSLTIELQIGSVRHHKQTIPPWTVDLVETGLDTQTGGRVKRLLDWMGRQTFLLTWGDGVSNIDLDKLVAFHKSHGKLATMTAVRPPARYGHIELDGDRVAEINPTPQTSEGWINGAFFVLEPQVGEYIEGDDVMFEHAPLQQLAADGELMAYRHDSFWQCMDTLREKYILQSIWDSGRAPWMSWEPTEDRTLEQALPRHESRPTAIKLMSEP
jgi:glucose-1-phosphate cytidylyltransferase